MRLRECLLSVTVLAGALHGQAARPGPAFQEPVAALRALGIPVRTSRFAAIRFERGEASASIAKGESTQALVWGRDLEAYAQGTRGQCWNKPLAFVGYGLRIPGAYDDLAGIGLKDHIAVMGRDVPDLPGFAVAGAESRSLSARVQSLAAAGAEGVILLQDGPLPAPLEGAGPAFPIPVVAMTPSALAPACGDLAARLQRLRETGRPQSQDFIYAPWSTFSLTLNPRRTPARVPLAVAVFPAQAAAGRKVWVLLQARADGRGTGGAQLGLEWARTFRRSRPDRTAVLALSAGPEPAADHWSRHSGVPGAKLVARVDLDRAARIPFGLAGQVDPTPEGLSLGGVRPGSAAEAAGLRAGDVLVSFAGHPVRDALDLLGALADCEPGTKATVAWRRKGSPMQADLLLRGRD